MGSIGPYLYICGGSDDTSRLETVERYDPFANAWVPSESMSCSRNGVGVCNDEERIYAIGKRLINTRTECCLLKGCDAPVSDGDSSEVEGGSFRLHFRVCSHVAYKLGLPH